MAATLFTLPKVIVFDANAALESGAKANFFITGTSTRQNTFTDKALTIAHDNPVVADGNGVFAPIYLDDTLNYKVDITDSLDVSLSGYPVDDLASLSSLVLDLASTANAKGASLIGIEDTATNFISTDVEAALAEIYSDYASTANTLGASLVGIEDTAGGFAATTVEAALAEIGPIETGSFVAAFTGFTSDPQNITFHYTRIGNMVMMQNTTILAATSNTALMSSGATDVPASIRPSITTTSRIYIVKDNGSEVVGKLQVTSGGQITHNADVSGSGFTTSGSKGFPGNQVISYFLD